MRTRKLWQYVCLVWAVLCMALPSFVWAGQNTPARAYVLALTDFHGRVEERGADVGLAKVMTAVQEFREQHPATVLVAVGDMFTGSVESDLLRGRPVLEGLRASGLSLSALGNHEFDWDQGDIVRWSREGLPFVCANVRATEGAQKGETPEGVKPFVLREVGGITIAFVGLLTPSTPRITTAQNTKGLVFPPPMKVLPGTVRAARKAGAEAVVVLAHMAKPARPQWRQGIWPELRELAKVPGVTAVVYGHSHEEHWGEEQGGAGQTVPLVQPLPYGRGLAVLEITRHAGGRVTATAALDSLTARKAQLQKNPQGEAIVAQAMTDVGPELHTVVAELAADAPHSDTQPSLLGEMVCDALRWATGTEVALVNGGGIRGSLDAGPVRVRDMRRVLPSNNTLRVMTFTGAELRQALENALNNTSQRCLQMSGLRATYDARLPEGRRVVLQRADGKAVGADDKVRMVVSSFLAKGGDGVLVPSMGTDKRFVKMSERDALQQYLQRSRTHSPAMQHWLTVRREEAESASPAGAKAK